MIFKIRTTAPYTVRDLVSDVIGPNGVRVEDGDIIVNCTEDDAYDIQCVVEANFFEWDVLETDPEFVIEIVRDGVRD